MFWKHVIKPKPLRHKSRESIIFEGKSIPFELVRTASVRGAYLKITATGLEVVIPLRYDSARLSKLLYEKKSWILKNLQKHAEQKSQHQHFQDGLTMPVFGQLKIIHIYLTTNKRARIRENENEINVFIPQNFKSGNTESFLPHNPQNLAKSKKYLEILLREKSKKYFEQRTRELGHIMQTDYGKITIRDQKTRWGSCSRTNNLNFNWRLIFMPLPVTDYIIIHELAHTIHHNHSKRFHDLVEKFCPDYKEKSKWLKQNQHTANW